jgi:hypothetical protein
MRLETTVRKHSMETDRYTKATYQVKSYQQSQISPVYRTLPQ